MAIARGRCFCSSFYDRA